MANPTIKDVLHTRDDDGNIVDVYPKTTDDQVEGHENYLKDVTCDDHTLTLTKGNGSTVEVDIANDIITDEEIIDIWRVSKASEKAY